jgi:hypothetical protein
MYNIHIQEKSLLRSIIMQQGRKRPLYTPKRMIKRREREGKRERRKERERKIEGEI